MLARIKQFGWKVYRDSVERLPVPLAVEALTRVLPLHFVVEPTNLCNHRCPLCPQPHHPRGRGRMDPAAFRRLAGEVRPFAANLCLNLLGESLLHRELFDMVRRAEDLGIPCSLTTNGHLLDERVEAVLDSRLSSLKVAVDGADAASHERYRVGGDFERVRRGLERVCAEKRRRGVERPHVTVLSLVFRHDQGQQDEIRRWSQSIGADRVGFKPVWVGGGRYTGAATADLAAEWLPEDAALHHDSFLCQNLCRGRRVCPRFHQAVVLWNGDLVPCGRCAWDGRDACGNVFEEGGFRAVWGSRRRREVLARLLRRESDLCAGCDTPDGGKWLG